MTEDKKDNFTNPELPQALHDAQILVSYAAEAGLELDPAILRVVVETGTHVRTSTALTDDQEAAFWQAFNQLCRAISPVSLSSLRATMDSYSPTHKVLGFDIGNRSKARSAVY